MIIFPAIDIMDGRCVRLTQGRSDESVIYGDPIDAAKEWIDGGAEWLHVVDLNGAFAGTSSIQKLYERIASLGVPIQLGGGIRSVADVRQRLESGISRVVIGTAAQSNPEMLAEACGLYGERVAVGIDAKNGYVSVNGWTETTSQTAADLARQVAAVGVTHIIYTDISRDGLMTGPNVEATRKMIEASGVNVIGSGGVGTLDHIAAFGQAGCHGVIVGKALYERRFTLKDAIKTARSVDS